MEPTIWAVIKPTFLMSNNFLSILDIQNPPPHHFSEDKGISALKGGVSHPSSENSKYRLSYNTGKI